MKFRITFNGRTKGAIGAFSNFYETVEADTEEQAFLQLYDKYDHITQRRVEVVNVDQSETNP